MHFGGHMSSAGGIYTAIDRIEAIGGDCVQVFTQSPRMWRPTAHKPEAIAQFRARRAEAGIAEVVCHALYLCNLAGDDEICAKSVATLRSTLETAEAIEADAVDLPRRLASRGRLRGVARESSSPALGAGARRARGRHVARDGELGRARAGRSAARSPSSRRSSTRSAATRGSGSASTPAISSPPATTSAIPARSTRSSPRSTRRSASTACVALHINDSATPLGSNRDRHANILEGEIGEGLGAFLAHPAFQELGAYMEVPGAGDGVGRERDEEAARAPRALDEEACDAEASGGVWRT